MYVRLNYGEEKSLSNGPEYYSLEVRYFDDNGEVFREATDIIEIIKFRGTKKIDLLSTYPLRYYRDSASIRLQLIEHS
jgi:hypothetical protein